MGRSDILVKSQAHRSVMDDLSRAPIVNTVHSGIKEVIRVTLENRCLGATLILVLSGIDAMAYLQMPTDQVDVTRRDFVRWAERYIEFPCAEQLTRLDLYGAGTTGP